ncbi:NAD-dependent epimerase/dehydratase [Acrodontium crateriforme]|uniref:NAD-dependent epimerase/dehydratase n=1 Tax=Acrodontium crateriforme TaxID=150365 RepID=A0AAQ3M8X0_9PEZI|nr:NAD-dependent epimerase/dehydratase [Acrodontium crateriforme]
MADKNDLVLVTGGSGFLGSHCIIALLAQNYRVRTTVRKLNRADEVRTMLRHGGVAESQAASVEFVALDLLKDDGWTEACQGCKYVLHVASPFPPGAPKHEDELIVPAREGTLRALRAAKASGCVKRVVVTSSFASIGYGYPVRKEPFTEKDWTVVEGESAYVKSKTIAEKAAWDFIEKENPDSALELATVNPVMIYGPVLGKDYASSILMVTKLMKGEMPGLPQISFGCVDVRDVADLHIRAMINPKGNGERFLAITDDGFLEIKEMAIKLKERLGVKANKVTTRVMPNFVLRIAGFFDPAVKLVVPELGKPKNATNAKAKELLDWQPRSASDTLEATALSLEKFNLL